jgi:hypothetical protein
MKAGSINRSRLAWTKWLPMSSVGAAISFVIGFVLQLPQHQVITATALTGALVFSGLAMQSFGREQKKEQQ